MIVEKKGNIFTTKAQTIVNTVNCVGVMGTGIAYEFRLRHKDMYEKYQQLCSKKQLDIGMLWIHNVSREKMTYKKVLNFPTKYDWKLPSKTEYLHKGLQKFVKTHQEKNITSIAFPLLGADKGGISPEESLKIMKHYLEQCSIDVEIWSFDPIAKDDLYDAFKKILLSCSEEEIKFDTKIGINIIKKIKVALEDETINSLSGLLQTNGVGDKSLEKLFQFMQNYNTKPLTLLDFGKGNSNA